tara:strand:- start:133 stop:885 length:753 start_codon:yes stop_codon:yes gene_type:complete
MTPTEGLYQAVQSAYDHFNRHLFQQALPPVLITMQRQRHVMGYFSADRWTSQSGKHCHEIAINPAYVASAKLIEFAQTLAHEMTHCWQHCYGQHQSQRSYHNTEWGKKMQEIGLMPSSTGRSGGRKTGQLMMEYTIPDGPFIAACVTLLNDKQFMLPWIDRCPLPGVIGTEDTVLTEALAGMDTPIIAQLTARVSHLFGEAAFHPTQPVNRSPSKTQYRCPSCLVNVWGKPHLRLRCDVCDLAMGCITAE